MQREVEGKLESHRAQLAQFEQYETRCASELVRSEKRNHKASAVLKEKVKDNLLLRSLVKPFQAKAEHRVQHAALVQNATVEELASSTDKAVLARHHTNGSLEALRAVLEEVDVSRKRRFSMSLARCARAWEDVAARFQRLASHLRDGAEGIVVASPRKACEARKRVPRLQLNLLPPPTFKPIKKKGKNEKNGQNEKSETNETSEKNEKNEADESTHRPGTDSPNGSEALDSSVVESDDEASAECMDPPNPASSAGENVARLVSVAVQVSPREDELPMRTRAESVASLASDSKLSAASASKLCVQTCDVPQPAGDDGDDLTASSFYCESWDAVPAVPISSPGVQPAAAPRGGARSGASRSVGTHRNSQGGASGKCSVDFASESIVFEHHRSDTSGETITAWQYGSVSTGDSTYIGPPGDGLSGETRCGGRYGYVSTGESPLVSGGNVLNGDSKFERENSEKPNGEDYDVSFESLPIPNPTFDVCGSEVGPICPPDETPLATLDKDEVVTFFHPGDTSFCALDKVQVAVVDCPASTALHHQEREVPWGG